MSEEKMPEESNSDTDLRSINEKQQGEIRQLKKLLKVKDKKIAQLERDLAKTSKTSITALLKEPAVEAFLKSFK